MHKKTPHAGPGVEGAGVRTERGISAAHRNRPLPAPAAHQPDRRPIHEREPGWPEAPPRPRPESPHLLTPEELEREWHPPHRDHNAQQEEG